MSTTLNSQNELMAKRASVIEEARELVNRAKKENRDLLAEEQELYDRMMVDVHSFKKQADREFNLAALEKELDTETRAAPKTQIQTSDLLYTVNTTAVSTVGTPEYRDAFGRFLRTNNDLELRALEVGVASEGGALVPTDLSNKIWEIATQGMSIFDLAEKVETDSGTFDIARVVTSGTAHLGSNEEADLSSLSTDVAFGTRSLNVNNRKASNYIVVSSELLSDSKFDLETFLATHGGNAIAERDEMELVNGAGTNGPTGFLSDADVGVTTSATFTYANLLTLRFSVRQSDRRNGTWVMNDTSVSQVLALEDTGNTLIFKPSEIAGGEDNLLGQTLRTSFAMADDGVGNKPVAYGNFFKYVLLTKPLSIKRSDDVLFATDQIAFRLTRRRDGRLAQDAAVKVINRTS